MNNKNEITDKVQKMYTQFPFPDVDCRMDYGLIILRFLKGLEKKRPGFWQSAKVMEAGCGTGNTLNHLAEIFPKASFQGVDLTPASLEKAQEKARSMELKNIKFQQENILKLNLEEKKFDVILCIGVLHHTADMMEGIKRLKAHLADDGVLILWLYGKHGRYRLNLNQRFFDLLLADVNDLSEKVVDMEDILALADGANLRMTKWFNVKNDLSGYIDDARVQSLYEKLGDRDQLLVKDLLLKPDYYTVALEKE